jgi:asparagine synthetase B (glutamine-hydrolysing)
VSGGSQGLADELALDVRRLWVRNLGRDDRLVADWGREARHPFLDENFMATLLDTPLSHIADLTLPPGDCTHTNSILVDSCPASQRRYSMPEHSAWKYQCVWGSTYIHACTLYLTCQVWGTSCY